MQMGRCGDVQSLFPFFALHSFPPFYLIFGESSLKRPCDMRYVPTLPITKRASEDSEEGTESVGWTEDVHCFFSPLFPSLDPDTTLTQISIVKDILSVFILSASIDTREICKLM